MDIDLVAVEPNSFQTSKEQADFFLKVKGGEFDVVIAAPPISSFCRLRTSGAGGPPPVRSGSAPLGSPRSNASGIKELKRANEELEFTIHVLMGALAAGS